MHSGGSVTADPGPGSDVPLRLSEHGPRGWEAACGDFFFKLFPSFSGVGVKELRVFSVDVV